MVLRFRCKQCDKRLKAGPQFAGARVRCPRCGAMIVVPSAAAPADGGNQDQPPTASAAADASHEEPGTMPSFAFGRRRLESDDELDMTPMVDVTFLLLIFFMITASFNLNKTLQFPPPDPEEKGAQQQPQMLEDFEDSSVIVEIDENNALFVDDEPLADPAQLADVLMKKGRSEQKTEIMITADARALHETVVAVVDAANEVGMQKIRLATTNSGSLD